VLVFFAHLFAPCNSLEQGNQQLQVPSELYGPIIAFLMKYCLAGELYSHLFGEICVCILPCQLLADIFFEIFEFKFSYCG